MIFERTPRNLNVFKRNSVIGKLLIIFVTFARDQDDVTRLCDFDCLGNRLRAVGDFFKMIAAKTFFNFGDNFIRIFFPRIIGGDDGVIRVLIDNLTHERPFLAVAITAATEDNNQAPRSEFAQSFENVEQRVGRVRVIDKNLELPLRRNDFETAGNLWRFSETEHGFA